MALPMPPNATCDIYRATNTPPSAPDVAGVSCYLTPIGQSYQTTPYFTHKLYVDTGVDIRDGSAVAGLAPTSPDTVWVPNKNGQAYRVILVRRYGRGTATDHYVVLLERQGVTWPQSNL
jgi:hypothetical protein